MKGQLARGQPGGPPGRRGVLPQRGLAGRARQRPLEMRWPRGLPSACCGVTLQSTLVPFAGRGASPSPRGTGAPQAWVQSFALTGGRVRRW